jgi:uncharacterized protein YciI
VAETAYVLISRYTAEQTRVEELVPAHRDYLRRHFASGLFVASGRRVPWTGGVIVARGPRAAVEAAVADDPFTREGVAETEIVEFEVLFGAIQSEDSSSASGDDDRAPS